MRIELTDEEYNAAREGLKELPPLAWAAQVDAVIGAINRVREGEPVATIRYHFERDRFYRREKYGTNGSHSHWAVYRCDAEYLNELPRDTDLIYRPEVA